MTASPMEAIESMALVATLRSDDANSAIAVGRRAVVGSRSNEPSPERLGQIPIWACCTAFLRCDC